MKVAGIQFDIAWEDPARNFERVETLAKEAAEAGADLVVLPEMFATGFSMKAEQVASHADRSLDFLRSLAADLQVAVVGGLAEPGEKRPANAAYAIAPDGSTLAHYRKLHPFSLAREDEHFEAGEALAAFRWKGVRVSLFICYDLRFPEPFRIAAGGTDLFLVIANWPERRSLAWRTLAMARAIENQAYLLGLNRVGAAEDVAHSGDSALIDPLGEIVSSRTGSEGLIVGEIDPDHVSSCRERFGFLLDRRPALYRRLETDQLESGDRS